MYRFCQEMVCVDIQTDADNTATTFSWMRRIQNIRGDLPWPLQGTKLPLTFD